VRATKEIGQALLARGSARSAFHGVVIRSTVPPGTIQNVVQPALEAELNAPAGSNFGLAMCPEFLREGSGVADFFDPPFTVVGTEQPQVGEMVSALFSFIDRPLHVVAVRTAEGLKYACNAFHAVKVAFTNELARLYRALGVDAREVMGLFCQDDRLNISPLYLRPGFAFGGSCLPKDLRSLLFLGRINSVDMPLLDGVLTSNDLAVRDIVKRVMASEGKNVALLGLSFKTQTDDLRESPNVELAEILLGKGYNVWIYDPVIQPSRLVGTNLQFIESRLPHLRRLLTSSAVQALEEADIAVVSSHDDEVADALVLKAPSAVIDVTGRLGKGVESLTGYEGAGW
jgi:GDP-mannose 6-dehydrogenase